MSHQFKAPNRRQVIKAAGAAVAVSSVGYWSGLAAAQSKSPNEKLNLACIGTANRALDNIKEVLHENIVALCDVDKNYLDQRLGQFKEARPYRDYRELIDKEGDKIDAVVVAVADHHHAPATVRASKAGKHVYCEKPLSHTVGEARLVAKLAKEKGLATQMGTQIHAGENYRRVVEMIQSGAIGDVHEVHVWIGKAWGGGDLPTETEKAPEYLDWNLWLGPAAERPFAKGRYHPAQWRRWWAFGSGTLGDMGCHYMDLPFWALELTHPTTIESEGPPVHAETAPEGMVARYEFPARGNKPPVKLTWYDGNMIPKTLYEQKMPGAGVLFVGSTGMMFADYDKYRFFPTEKFSGYKPPAPTIPRSIGHHKEWLKACRDGSPTTCNFQYSGGLSESVLLGTVAYRVGKKLQWDAEQLKATNAPEADKMINKSYRAGWEVS
ncbi:MAG: Gfo/Idh/MocA family oxidoreductase [Pirellulaceae bacterium]|nr:Gfo/Idh/MocA family oxidoreductase [Pirellulaceae bacterium]